MTILRSRGALRAAAAACALLVAAGCGGDPVGSSDAPARLRVFQAVTNLASSPAGSAVDVLVNGAVSSPGAAAVAPGTATAYAPLQPGLHQFAARITGDARRPDQANLFRFDARLQTVAGFDYTLYAIGVVPAGGTPDVAPLMVVDDPFPPSALPGGGGRHARVRLVNAAPYAGGLTAGTGTPLRLFVTPGDRPPTSVAALAWQSTAVYRGVSPPVELPPGVYTFTVARTNNAIVARTTVTLAPGAARTLVVVGTQPTTTPNPTNHRVEVLVDRDFTGS